MSFLFLVDRGPPIGGLSHRNRHPPILEPGPRWGGGSPGLRGPSCPWLLGPRLQASSPPVLTRPFLLSLVRTRVPGSRASLTQSNLPLRPTPTRFPNYRPLHRLQGPDPSPGDGAVRAVQLLCPLRALDMGTGTLLSTPHPPLSSTRTSPGPVASRCPVSPRPGPYGQQCPQEDGTPTPAPELQPGSASLT